jgi:hypothetical protein
VINVFPVPIYQRQIFAGFSRRLGCQAVASAVNDITKISTLADELESAWQKILLLFENVVEDKTARSKGEYVRV